MTTGMEQMTTEQVVQILNLAAAELAVRAVATPQAPPNPFAAILAAAGVQQPPQPPAQMRPLRPAQEPRRMMIGNEIQQPMPMNIHAGAAQRIQPGTVIATARTDPDAAAVFMGTRPRADLSSAIEGNGVGLGGYSEHEG